MNEEAVVELLQRAEAAWNSHPEAQKPSEYLFSWLIANITLVGTATLDDLTLAVSTYERDIARRTGGQS